MRGLENGSSYSKRTEIDAEILITYIWSIFDLVVFKVILGSFVALVPKCPVTRKKAGSRVKGTEIWDSWVTVTHIRGTLDLVGFNVIWGSFGALVSNWAVSRKRLA